jgi:hypothetical protein
MGGLGNQLFQIFTTISYAIKSNNEYKFLNVKTLGGGDVCTLRYTFWDTLFKKLQTVLIDSLPELLIIKQLNFEFNEIPISVLKNRNVCIDGYFQSYKFIQEYFYLICNILEINKMRKEVLEKSGLQKEYLNNTISMHFRLGDYKNLLHVHNILNPEYYINSLKHIQEREKETSDLKVLYFCEDEDLIIVEKTIQKCTNHFPNYTFERAPTFLADWEQMLLMSECKHHIIANSSFSWWGAYFSFKLNNHIANKNICYPSTWFGPCATENSKDLCPPEWTKIQC